MFGAEHSSQSTFSPAMSARERSRDNLHPIESDRRQREIIIAFKIAVDANGDSVGVVKLRTCVVKTLTIKFQQNKTPRIHCVGGKLCLFV
jgi:hypothetical protein